MATPSVTNVPQPESVQVSGSAEPRAPKEGYQPSPEDQKIIARVTERIGYSGRDSARWALERQAFENVCFFCGVQWIEYTESTRRYSRWSAPAWMPTPVTNAIGPRANTMMAALLRVDPKGKVRPDSNEPKDREAAKVGDALLTHVYEVTKERMIRQRAANLAILTGTVIAEDYYNPRAGKTLRIPQQQIVEDPVMEPTQHCDTCQLDVPPTAPPICPTCGGELQPGERPRLGRDGQPLTMPKSVPVTDPMTGEEVVNEVPEGEIEARVRGQFNFYWDPKATYLDEARWAGEALYADLDWIDENYPEMGPYVTSESGLDGSSFFETSLLALVGPSIQGTAHYGGGQYLTNGAMLRKYQEKPSQKYPKGLHVVVANGVKLYEGPLPIQDENGNPTGDFSYTMFRFDEVPGRLLGRSPVDDMVPLQRRINGIDAQLILNRKTLLNPWILAPKGSGLDPGAVAMRPGATITYNFIGVGTSPQVVQGTPLPAQIYEERSQAMQAMDALAADIRVQTQVPTGVRSGLAMTFLREQIEEQGAPRLQRWGQWIAERDRKRLLLIQRHYHEQRAVKLMGKGAEWQVRYFSGADLAGSTDVFVDPATLVPRSTSIRNQMIFDAIEAGIINPLDPMDKQRLIEELNLSGFETQIGADYRRALKENAILEEGQPVAINQYDQHEVHLPAHINAIQDPSFDQWTPEAQQAMQQHVHMHEDASTVAEEEKKQQYLKDETTQLDMEAKAKGMQIDMKRAAKTAALFGGDPGSLGTGTGTDTPPPMNGSGNSAG